MHEQEESERSNGIDWICTALAILVFFAYILVIAYYPEFLREPLMRGTVVSVGIASGVFVTIFLVALAGIYAWARNRFPRL